MQSPDPRVVIDPHGVRIEVEEVAGVDLSPGLAISIRAGAVSMRATVTVKEAAFLLTPRGAQ